MLAKFLGIYLLIIVAIWLTRRTAFEKGIKEVISSDGMFALTGGILIIVGLVISIAHSIFTWNWQGLITLIGYFSLLQGVLRLAFPVQSRRILLRSLDRGYWIWIILAGALGGILTYKGFII